MKMVENEGTACRRRLCEEELHWKDENKQVQVSDIVSQPVLFLCFVHEVVVLISEKTSK